MEILNCEQAVAEIRAGGLVAVPTESSYALCSRIDHGSGIVRLLEIKTGRQTPVATMVANLSYMTEFINIDDICSVATGEHFWPGPLTLLFPARASVDQRLLAGSQDLGVRIPKDPRAMRLLNLLEMPVTATSANFPGSEPITDCDDLGAQFPDLPVLFGGDSGRAVPSTVATVQGGDLTILREGAVTSHSLEKFVEKMQAANG